MMLFRKFKNEDGISLVELLAALSLFAIVIALLSTVIIQMENSEEKASGTISLQQDTNVLLSELRNQYYKRDFKLCYSDNNQLVFPMNSSEEDFSIKSLTINSQSISHGNCVEIAHHEPLSIILTTVNSTDRQITVETTIAQKEKYALHIASNKDGIFDKKEDFEDIVIEDSTSFISGDTNDACDFYGNTKFPQTRIKKPCKEINVYQGSAWFPNNISIGSNVNFTVQKNVYSDKNFELNANTELIIGNSAKLKGPAELGSNSSIEVNNLYALSNLALSSNARIHTLGGLRINGTLTLSSNSKVIIDQHLFAMSATTFSSNAEGTIGGNATFAELLSLESNASLQISGNAIFYEDIELKSNAKIKINGDATFCGNVNRKDSVEVTGTASTSCE